MIITALKFDASDLGSKSDPNSAFNISKAMLNAYTSVVAKQLEKDGFSDIKVNGVIPALYTPPAPAHPTAPAHPLLNKVFGAPKPRSTVGLSAEEPYGWANKSHVVEAVIHLATDEKLNLNGKIFNESLQVVRGW
jgi:NAD(P)-dependent dehydrogenase (short-subunit alcohol dehydrogenase family)